MTLTADRPTTAQQQCDRCTAPAKIRVELPDGTDLVFCGHHHRQYEPQLIDVAFTFEALAT